MKGLAAPEVLATFAIACIVALALMMVPSLIEDAEALLSISSSETVALDLGGLATISAAAPESITLSYSGVYEDKTYSIEISDERVCYVSTPIESVKGTSKLGIYLQPQSYEDVKEFSISKSRPDGENVYEFVAEQFAE